jgi:hypothetical protein
MSNNSFERDDKIAKAVDKLYQHLKNADYGTEYSWADVKLLTGLPQVSQERTYYIASRVNDLLLGDSRYLETVPGVGKRLLNPDEHRVSARKQVKRSARIYRKAGKILAATNIDEISSVDERQKVISDANKFRTMELLHDVMLRKDKRKVIGDAGVEKSFFDLVGFLKD